VIDKRLDDGFVRDVAHDGGHLTAICLNRCDRLFGLPQIGQRYAEAPFREYLSCPAPDTLGAASNRCN